MTNVKIVTVATESQYYFPYLIETIKKNNGDIDVLGYKKEWQGFTWRYELMINYLKNIDFNDIVCFVDGYDVICVRDLTDLKTSFLELKREYKCKIIVSEHKHISRHNNFIHQAYFGSCNKQLINAGTYIGYVKDILTIITNMYQLSSSNASDDQILMTKYCQQNPSDFYIDTKSEIFLVLDLPYNEVTDQITIKNNNIYYKNKRPFFIHGAGSTYLDDILLKLGHKDINVKDSLREDYYKKIAMYIHPSIYNIFIKYNNVSSNEKYMYCLIFIFLVIIIYIVYKYSNYSYFYKLLPYKKNNRR